MTKKTTKEASEDLLFCKVILNNKEAWSKEKLEKVAQWLEKEAKIITNNEISLHYLSRFFEEVPRKGNLDAAPASPHHDKSKKF